MFALSRDHDGRTRSSLLCGLGWHKTNPLAHWNDGYYFSKCRRCGRDLVRTAFGRWTVPTGYRVVWTAEPPRRTRPVQLIRAGDATDRGRAVDAGQASTIEFPIRETAEAPPQPQIEPQPQAEPEPQVEPEPELQRAVDGEGPASLVPDEIASKSEARSDGDDDVRPVAMSAPAHVASESRLPIPDMLRNLQDEGTGSSGPVSADPVPAASLPDGGDDRALDRRDDHEITEYPAPEKDDGSAQVDEPETAPATVIEAEATAQVPAITPPLIPDFMDGGTLAVPYDLRTGALLRPTAPDRDVQASSERASDPDGFDGPGQYMRRATGSARASMGRRSRPDRRSDPDQSPSRQVDPRKHRPTFLERQGGLVAAALFGGLVLAAALIDNQGSDAARNVYGSTPTARVPVRRAAPVITPVSPVASVGPVTVAAEPVVEAVEPAEEPVSPAAPPTPPVSGPMPVPASAPGDDRAYVTASLLNCRAVPSDDAATVRRLRRGAPVQVLGVDPGWINISHGGQRCWASAEFISTVRPI